MASRGSAMRYLQILAISTLTSILIAGCASHSTPPPLSNSVANSVVPGVVQTGQPPIFREFTIPTANSGPVVIVKGPDGAMWFTEGFAHKIGRITTDGAITEFTVGGSDMGGIAVGPDGNIWFTLSAPYVVGKMTPTGQLTEFTIPPPIFA